MKELISGFKNSHDMRRGSYQKIMGEGGEHVQVVGDNPRKWKIYEEKGTR